MLAGANTVFKARAHSHVVLQPCHRLTTAEIHTVCSNIHTVCSEAACAVCNSDHMVDAFLCQAEPCTCKAAGGAQDTAHDALPHTSAFSPVWYVLSICLHAHHHAHIVPAIRPCIHGPQCTCVQVSVHTTISVHQQVACQVSTQDRQFQRPEGVMAAASSQTALETYTSRSRHAYP